MISLSFHQQSISLKFESVVDLSVIIIPILWTCTVIKMYFACLFDALRVATLLQNKVFYAGLCVYISVFYIFTLFLLLHRIPSNNTHYFFSPSKKRTDQVTVYVK